MNIAVVSATRDKPNGSQLKSLTMAERAFSCPIKCFPLWDNSKGLSEAYNDFLNNHQAVDKSKNKGFDCVLFIHDDLEIRDTTINEQLENAKKEGYDVVGIAGSKAYRIPDPNVPTGWWSPVNAQCGMSGQVLHKGQTSMTTAYGPSPARVLVIDGLFICLMNRGLELRFNEQFRFDHYDMDLCLSAYVKGMKVGVFPILCSHDSPGNGFNSP